MHETPRAGSESGFSLVEALAAVLILSFGLMAITNLFIVAGTSNQVANQSTAATAQATEVMERLMALPFDQLNLGGSLEADKLTGAITADGICKDDGDTSDDGPTDDGTDCVGLGHWNGQRLIYGVGLIRTRWKIEQLSASGPTTYFIQVRSEAIGTLSPQRTRQELNMFRACTTDGCP
jgi:competence protein ComGC